MTSTDMVVSGGAVIGGTDRARRDILISAGRVADELPVTDGRPPVRLDAAGGLVGPGLVDLQVNGVADADLNAVPEQWDRVAATLARAGTTAFCPTLVSAPAESLVAALAVFDQARSGGHPLAPMLCGAHLEGPFLAPGRAGAHDPAALRAVDPDEIEAWSTAGAVALVTLAPEAPGALAAVRALVDAGIVVSLGHSEASAADALAALDAGAGAVTHLFNAMAPFHHRAPGLVGVALTDPRPVVTLIADGVHLDRRAVELAWRALGPRRRCLVSDAVATTLGARPLIADGDATRTGDGVLAGSTGTLLDAVRWIVDAGIATLDEAWQAASATPATLIGRRDLGHLRPGARGDLVIVDDDLRVRTTIVAGRVV